MIASKHAALITSEPVQIYWGEKKLKSEKVKHHGCFTLPLCLCLIFDGTSPSRAISVFDISAEKNRLLFVFSSATESCTAVHGESGVSGGGSTVRVLAAVALQCPPSLPPVPCG